MMRTPTLILRLLGYSVWYHGTLTRADGESIEREGLKSRVYGTAGRRHPYYLLASHKDDASAWTGPHGAIVTIRVPRARAAEYLTGDPMESRRIDRRLLSGINKPIPPDMIIVKYLDGR